MVDVLVHFLDSELPTPDAFGGELLHEHGQVFGMLRL